MDIPHLAEYFFVDRALVWADEGNVYAEVQSRIHAGREAGVRPPPYVRLERGGLERIGTGEARDGQIAVRIGSHDFARSCVTLPG
jgi:hypothetical protein